MLPEGKKITRAQKLLISTSTVFLKSSCLFPRAPPFDHISKLCQDLHVKEKITESFLCLAKGEKRGTIQRNLTGEVYDWQIYITTQMKRPIRISTNNAFRYSLRDLKFLVDYALSSWVFLALSVIS